MDQGRHPCLLQEASVFDYHCWNLLLLPHPQKYKQLPTPLSITPPHIGIRPLSEVPPPWDLKHLHEVLTAVTLPAPGGVNKNERHLSKAPSCSPTCAQALLVASVVKKKKKKKKILGCPWYPSGWESARQCRGRRFDPCPRKIPQDAGQLNRSATTNEPMSRND